MLPVSTAARKLKEEHAPWAAAIEPLFVLSGFDTPPLMVVPFTLEEVDVTGPFAESQLASPISKRVLPALM
jgi:hypothetical protein